MMKSKILVFYFLLIVGALLLLLRLFELQLILGKKNLALAEGNRIRQEVILAPRGIIFDRNRQPLVRNIPVYRLKKEDCQGEVKNCFQIISRQQALKIKAQGGEKAERLQTQIGRDYLYGSSLAHLVGYLNWELKGAIGLEKKYNQILQGQDGGEIYEVDTRGVKIREIEKIEPVPGQDLNLFLDADLSKVAFEALENKKGAVVATEAKTGRVLVLVSSPSFDPNLFNRPDKPETNQPGGDLKETIRDKQLTALFDDQAKPMFNRAIGGVYPPGSTFKIVTATAGLEEKKIDEKTLIEDHGVIKIGPYSYTNWLFTKYGRTEGKINLVRAIKRSTDTFFYKVGEKIGADRLAEWAKAFGLGRLSGIDLGGEATGLVPTPEWKEENTGERWFLGNTYHLAIGQADLLSTPLQINMMTSVIANQGRLCRPQIARLKEAEEPSCQNLKLDQETLRLVKEGLKEACLPEGTAGVFFNFEPRVAGKTGTAEFGPVKANGFRETHAWFTAFAPADDPEIVVTALVEGGGEGSTVAAPIVKKVIEAWF